MRNKLSRKRVPSVLAGSSRKKLKVEHDGADNLPWTTVSRPVETGLDGDDGILELEEVEGVEITYEETESGRVARFNFIGVDEARREEEKAESSEEPVTGESEVDVVVEEEHFDSEKLLPNWHPYNLHPQLTRCLHHNKFLNPTPIQAAAIPLALKQRDVVGVAQTGSGKTLAYGLPILHKLLLAAPQRPSSKHRPVQALILAPTRELALQVSTHLNACLSTYKDPIEIEHVNNKHDGRSKEQRKGTEQGDLKSTAKKPPPTVSAAAIVGGMSVQKQKRILDRGVDVLVATPGRLWDIIEENETLAKELKRLRFLVLDEADRMIEAGHFAELDNILRLTLRESLEDRIPDDVPSIHGEPGFDVQDDKEKVARDQMQTFVFSATLSKDLQKNVKRRAKPQRSKHPQKNNKPASTLDDLLLRLDFRDRDPEVIDLSPEGGVVSTLTEGKIQCLSADKDVYLYYFLLRYPGRSLVFLSSIDGIRRLSPLAELLNIKAFPLHSQLEQRQRLKNLDRFKSTPNSVLLATDIAARGLDIPSVDHVIHYQIPRSADVYIHRNGRTARAMRKGFSMLMCAPDERKVVRALLGNLRRQEDEIQEMSIDLGMLDKLKARVQLARKIETTHHKSKKAKHERTWMKETAEAMEIELDSDFASDSDGDNPNKRQRKADQATAAALKAQLKQMLAQPLIARGISAKYITSGSNHIVDELISGEYNEKMLGVGVNDAGSDLGKAKRKKRDPKAEDSKGLAKDVSEVEWMGIDIDHAMST
ncbi:ATP-dependent RNA helicase [Lentinula edodes]|uniref:P-loop containing nucleoside triphosphate hydrolase protein n=1 Tax=Lentinula edodes TaxID=5353 RepID=UPI001E8CD406|nr:P-loop containing nucleoside triphosphate hydrolase protein [Lentinula edodes]KAH7868473.1 P-loop containing nucleoside triphosphate hydrolase protein [Lentinula edodes]KAJ3902728.1 ATP-dependent RNA helicase [Lentinula edodes]